MLTKADELRLCLDKIDADLGKLGFGLGEQALDIPIMMDKATQFFEEFEEEGHSLIEDKLHFETISRQLRSKAAVWLREAGGMAVLIDARRTRQPAPDQWWWFLDEQVAQTQKRSLKRTLRWALGALLVLALLGVVYQLFLRPDPATEARIGYLYDAESKVESGDLDSALQLIDKALAGSPGDAELLIFKGVLQQLLGQAAEAESSFQAAQDSLKNMLMFYLVRGQRYYLLQSPQAALEDAQAALKIDNQSAAGYLLQGQAQEALGQGQEALDSYQRSSDLANEQEQYQVAVTARMLYGNLLQRQGFSTAAPQP